jgi:hypothetical protein
MAETVDIAFVHAYSAEITRQYAAIDDKVRQAVRVKSGVKGKTYHFERLADDADFASITSRHQPTHIMNPTHSRRRVTFVDKGGAYVLDRHDEVKMLIQPKNDYAVNHAHAWARFINSAVFTAALGSSTSVIADDTTASVALGAGQQIAAGGVGLTFEKCLQAARILNENNVPKSDRYFAISPQGLEDLLSETEVTSSDFTQLMALKSGTLQGPYLGFNWIETTQLAKASTTRSCIAWHKDSMGLVIPMELEVHITQRDDLNNAWQANALLSAGATRVQEEGVVQCDITES